MILTGYRLGVDIGGTFTDAVLMNSETGDILFSKVSTTPSEPSLGFMNAVTQVTKQIENLSVEHIIHATTIATNAIIEGKVARTAFVTTRGFRDILELQRQIKPKLYDVFFDKPRPLVPRRLCYEVSERLTAEGEILVPLNEADVRNIAGQLIEEGVESVALCFIHSYRNSDHEKRAAKILADLLPGVYLTVSSELSPQHREYTRASTTVINAAIMPIVARYVKRLEKDLTSKGFPQRLYIMQSNGGLMTSRNARAKPAFMIESVPAAGVVATAAIGNLLGKEQIISFDMGGTTAKAGLITRGEPRITYNYEVGAVATPETGLTKGAGYPLRTPVIDLVEIGAGGGSEAWVDSGGVLKVGPRSAGAEPGPACYGKGGVEPTITDANLLLGRIDPSYFLGGEMKLDVKAAERAVEERCVKPLGKELSEVSYGILEIANANMLRALRLVSVERGHDPRDHVIVAFGGAGPMHVNALAKELDVKQVIVPPSPGLASALGLLLTDLKHDYVQTFIQRTDSLDLERVNDIYRRMEEEATSLLSEEGVTAQNTNIFRAMEMRYVGQSYELTVPAPNVELLQKDIPAQEEKFYAEHERSYGHATRTEPTQVVNLKLSAIGIIFKPTFRKLGEGSTDPSSALRNVRKVYFRESGGFTDTNVYDRNKLVSRNVVRGPAIIEEVDSTTVIHPNYQAEIEGHGFLTISKE